MADQPHGLDRARARGDLRTRVGGRIFERTSDGTEHDWGRIVAWEPPHRLVYSWHLRVDRSDATEVEIRFTDLDRTTTRVDIEHRGWERLGARGSSAATRTAPAGRVSCRRT